MNSRILIQLAKTGDVLNLLPLAWDYHQKGERIGIMVAKQFADVLDGCAYVDKIVYDGEPWELDKAWEQAQKLSSNICCVQTSGPEDLVRKFAFEPNGQTQAISDSFQKEAWRLAGRLGIWKDQPPLVFDRRVPEREQGWFPKGWQDRGRKKKLMLVAAGGETSPFPYRPLLWELLRLKFSHFNIIDLSLIKAERFYDLLGLYEMAHCIVATDSAPLHLAYACDSLPVVALINDRPSLWHGSVWRANHVFHCRYGDFPTRAVEMLEAIERIGTEKCWSVKKWTAGRIIHVWSRYEESEANQERCKEARQTWEKMAMVETPVELGALGRTSKNKLKDDVRFPFVKDVIRLAMLRAEQYDLIVLTRADTAFKENRVCGIADAPCYAHRTIRNEDGDTWHPAVDVFGFQKQWWMDHEREYPQDMILGIDGHWHRVMLELFKNHGAKELKFIVYRAAAKNPTAPENHAYVHHNEKLARNWMEQNGVTCLFPAAMKQIEAVQVNPKALPRWAYNCSLVRWQDRYLLAVRHHGEKNQRTSLAIAELDDAFNVTNVRPVELTGSSFEDPRFFTLGEALYMSFVESNWPEMPPMAVIKYGKVVNGQNWILEDIKQPAHGKNDWTGLEKNWIWFEHNSALWCLYQSSPEQIVYNADIPLITKGPRWPWGKIKGGTAPVSYEGQLLRFFHSTLDNEPAPDRRRYYIGAMLMEPQPPFAVTAISREPILRGSEEDGLEPEDRRNCPHFKAKVVFPAGCVQQDGGWLLSLGVNDSSCVIAKIKPGNLRL